MPNFGYNPFITRSNVYTTGVETGDARRYYSRDVIRTGGERVEIDATLTPGEAGKRQQTLFEKQVSEMVKKEKEFALSEGKKREFINGERIQSSGDALVGLKSQEEVIMFKKEEKRREELSLYNLSDTEINKVIEYERQFQVDINEKHQLSHLSSEMRSLYDKIELQKQQYLTNQSLLSKEKEPLHILLDRKADDFFTFQRMKNPILNGHDNTALKKAEEGLVDSHFPRANMKRLLEEIDREFVQQHPFMKEEIEQLKTNEKKKKKIKIDSDTFLDVNTPLENERDYKKIEPVTPQIDIITDEYIKNNRLSIEEMEKLPQMKKYCKGEPSATLFIRNLPRSTTQQDLVAICGRFENPNKEMDRIQYTLLKGRMKGQAFVTFSTIPTASSALDLLHGFVFKGKPLIVEFQHVPSFLVCSTDHYCFCVSKENTLFL